MSALNAKSLSNFPSGPLARHPHICPPPQCLLQHVIMANSQPFPTPPPVPSPPNLAYPTLLHEPTREGWMTRVSRWRLWLRNSIKGVRSWTCLFVDSDVNTQRASPPSSLSNSSSSPGVLNEGGWGYSAGLRRVLDKGMEPEGCGVECWFLPSWKLWDW